MQHLECIRTHSGCDSAKKDVSLLRYIYLSKYFWQRIPSSQNWSYVLRWIWMKHLLDFERLLILLTLRKIVMHEV